MTPRRFAIAALAATAVSLSAAGGALAAPGDVVLVSPPSPADPGDTSMDIVPATSGTGAFVAFLHEATFGSPEEAHPGAALYLRSMASSSIVPVDIPTTESAGNGHEAGSPSLDRSGRFLSFVSEDPDISPDDKDYSSGITGTYAVRDAFVYDRASGKITLVSRKTGADGAAANNDSNLPAISADGRYVAFGTEANNIAPRKKFGGIVYGGVYVRDLKRKTTTLVSRANGRNGGPLQGYDPSISADGGEVAFVFLAGPRGHRDQAVYVRDINSGRTTLVSHARGRDCIEPSLSADGRTVAYTCEARSRDKGVDQVYVTNLASGRVSLASRGAGKKGKPGGGDSSHPSISASGRQVAFESYANDLGPADSGRVTDIFVKDLKSGKVTLASRGTGGGPAGNAPSANPSISGDGRFVSFESRSSNLAPEDTDRNSSVFRYQLLP